MRLNIGCGPNLFQSEEWIQYDREDMRPYMDMILSEGIYHEMPEHQKNLVRYLQRDGIVNFVQHDLRQGFKQHEDDSIDGIYVGQTIEHLNPIYEMPKFLAECYRMLRPGGVLRMTTPDLDLLIDRYLQNQMDDFIGEQPGYYKEADPSTRLAFLIFGAGGPDCNSEHYEGHFFLFTKHSMTKALESAGFKAPFSFYYEPGTSEDSVMVREAVDAGMSHSFAVEALK